MGLLKNPCQKKKKKPCQMIFNISVIVVLSLLSIFSHSNWDFLGSWYDEWFSVETWGFGVLFKYEDYLNTLFYLASSDTSSSERGDTDLLLSDGHGSPVSPLSVCSYPRRRVSSFLLDEGGSLAPHSAFPNTTPVRRGKVALYSQQR